MFSRLLPFLLLHRFPALRPGTSTSLNSVKLTSGDLTLEFSTSTGQLQSATAKNGWFADLTNSTTRMGKIVRIFSTKVHPCNNSNHSLCVERDVTALTETSDSSSSVARNITLIDEYHPVHSHHDDVSVFRWTSSVVSSSISPWRSQWTRELLVRQRRQWWLSSSGPVGTKAPRFDALQTRDSDARNTNCSYGGTAFWHSNPHLSPVEVCPFPVSVHGQESLGGLGHVLAINASIISAHATSADAGGIIWTRLYDRIGGHAQKTKPSQQFVSYLVFTTRDWRSVLRWTRDTFEGYYDPVTALAATDYSQLGGMGAYSCANVAEGIVAANASVSPSVIWDAHFWWPYQGMFFPPTKPGEEWRSNMGTGEQNGCGSRTTAFQHGQIVSDALIREEYLAAKKLNVTMLSYFNFNYFGQNIILSSNKHSLGDDAPLTSNLWTNSSAFLMRNFPEAYLPGPIYDWQRSVEMTTTDLAWLAWLVSQAKATRTRIGDDAFRGLVVDEPRLGQFILGTDDHLTWCGRPCSATLFAWINASKAVRQQALSASLKHVLIANQIDTFRMDSLLHYDGVFTETNSDSRFSHSAAVATAGLLTSGRMPGIVWTNVDDDVTADIFHQQHLLYGVQPMAPYLGNDHAVQPGQRIYAAYEQYQVLYEWLKGSRWWLDGAITVTNADGTSVTSSFVSNMFEAGDIGERIFVLMVRRGHSSEEGGDYNNGDYNTGDYNNGDYNDGDYNNGDYNTGDYYNGDYNNGDYNNGDYYNQSISVSVNRFPDWVDAHTCFSHSPRTGDNVAFVPTASGVFPSVGVGPGEMLCVHCSENHRDNIPPNRDMDIPPNRDMDIPPNRDMDIPPNRDMDIPPNRDMDGDVVVTVTEEVVNYIDRSFLSFTLDTAFFCEAQSSESFFANSDIRHRASLFMPFSLRVGGTQSDYSQAGFGPHAPELPGVREKKLGCNYTLSQLQRLMSFASSLDNDVDVHVVFGLNSLTREGSTVHGKWNAVNARALVNVSSMHSVSWELGNEPVLWSLQPFARNISAAEHAADYEVLRQLAPSSQLIGPDFFVQCLPQYPNCDVDYLDSFLTQRPALDVVTFHLYPWLGTIDEPTTPTPASMMNIILLDQAGTAARAVVSAVTRAKMTSHPVWMGEGSPDWKTEQDGSALGRNFTFEFAWLDMMGQFASNGVQRVFRQTISSVIGRESTGRMSPAFFMSLLWKKLVTQKNRNNDVAKVYRTDVSNTTLRSYAIGTTVIILNTNPTAMAHARLISHDCRAGGERQEWHCVGGPDVVGGRVHGLLVNGKQPLWDKNRNEVDFGMPVRTNCSAVVDVEAGGVVFVVI